MLSKTNRTTWFGLLLLAMAGTHWTLFRSPAAQAIYGGTMGRPSADWVLLVDLLVTIPLLYWLIFRPTPKAMLKPCVALALGGVLFGTVAIPDGQKNLWRVLDDY